MIRKTHCMRKTVLTQWGDKVMFEGTFRVHVDPLKDSFRTHSHPVSVLEVFHHVGSELLR
jgi:hypothetical protein